MTPDCKAKWKIIEGGYTNNEAGKPLEDAIAYSTDPLIVCLADGVTLSRSESGTYPIDSPAATCAKLAVDLSLHTISKDPMLCVQGSLLEGFSAANVSIANFNRLHRHSPGELPGTVLTVLRIQDESCSFAHLGDAVCCIVRQGGELQRILENQTHALDEWASKQLRKGMAKHLVKKSARDLFRNKLGLVQSYGVLTGEPAALTFVVTGYVSLEHVSSVIIASDGLRPVLERCLVNTYDSAQLLRLIESENIEQILTWNKELIEFTNSRQDDVVVALIKRC